MNSNVKGSILIVLSTLLFSSQTVLVRFLSDYTIAYFGYYQVFFMIFITSFLVLTKKTSEFRFYHPKWLLFSSAAVVIILIVSYHYALRMTTLANAVLTHYTAPIFAFILAVIFLKERFEWYTVFAIAFSMLGIFFIFFGEGSFVLAGKLGILLGLVSGITFGIDTVMNKKLTDKGHIPSILFHKTWPMVIVLLPFVFSTMLPLNDLFIVAAMALFGAFIPSFIFFNGIRLVKGKHVSIIAYSEILFVVALGFIFFKELPGSYVVLGGALIIVSGMWIIMKEAKLVSNPF